MVSTHFVSAVRRSLLLCFVATALSAAGTSRVPGLSVPGTREQTEQVDVGSFTLFINEQRAGREQFSMRRVITAEVPTLELRAESAIGDRRTAVQLETDSAGTPIRYSVEERSGSTVTLRLGGQRVRGRFTTQSRSTTGEAAREYLLAPGALVLEDNGVLQYALLVRNRSLSVGDSVVIPVFTPIANRQGTVRLALLATSDTVVIAGSRRAAQRWRVVTSGGEARLIWADTSGRLLRVNIPSRGFDAMRDDVPR